MFAISLKDCRHPMKYNTIRPKTLFEHYCEPKKKARLQVEPEATTPVVDVKDIKQDL